MTGAIHVKWNKPAINISIDMVDKTRVRVAILPLCILREICRNNIDVAGEEGWSKGGIRARPSDLQQQHDDSDFELSFAIYILS